MQEGYSTPAAVAEITPRTFLRLLNIEEEERLQLLKAQRLAAELEVEGATPGQDADLLANVGGAGAGSSPGGQRRSYRGRQSKDFLRAFWCWGGNSIA